MDLNGLLTRAVELGASDIHLKVGQPPILRLDGDLGPLEGHPPLDDAALAGVRAAVGAPPPPTTPPSRAVWRPPAGARPRRSSSSTTPATSTSPTRTATCRAS